MKLGSLFDGSGGFPLAGHLCGITPAFASEVEPYPIAVTTSRFPTMKHLGSVTDIHGAEIEPVDIITFGSPCQDLSVAGKRAGLKHEANGDEETTRSGLFIEAVRIIKEMRRATNGLYPTFAVWENVPGAFSSNRGEDFRIVLEELIKIVEPGAVMPAVPQGGWAYADSYSGDGWSLSYRTLDAQYWGVPQRRRRIYLVLDLRGERAHKVLFEREGLRGYFEEGRSPWQGSAGNAENCTATADSAGERNCLTPWDVQSRRIFTADGQWPALYGGEGGGHGYVCYQGDNEHAAYGWPLGFRPENVRVYEETATTICNGTRPGFTTGVIQPVNVINLNKDDVQSKAILDPAGIAPALYAGECRGGGGECYVLDKAPSGNNQPVVCYESAGFKANQGPKAGGIGWQEEMACTLNADRPGLEPTVCIKEQHLFENHAQDARYKGPLDVCPMLPAQLGTGGNNTPLVAETIPIHDQATRFSGKRGDKSDGKGNGLGVGNPGDPMNTLTSGDRHAVVYGVTPASFYPQMKAESQCFRADGVANTIVNGTNPGFQNGVVQPVAYTMQGFGDYKESGVASGLKARDYKDATDLVAEIAGVDCRNMNEYPNLYPTLQAKPNGGQSLNFSGAVRVRYIVRRLTPTECARLQGFPDNWGHINPKEDFTDEEYRFWLDVRNTHAAINGKTTKEYTREQMLTWYSKLHTDSAEYKMWGNGIALPTALYVMQGIAEALERERNRKKVLELFCGTKSISKAFAERDHEVYTVDWEKDFNPTLCADIGNLTAEQIIELCGGVPDIIWASPDCTSYSVAAISYHRKQEENGNLTAITEYAKRCDTINAHVVQLIKELNPKYWFIENPRGGMRKMDFMQGLPRYTVTYCKYGDTRMKPTDIWTNHPQPNFIPPCKNGEPCHEPAPRGSRTGTQKLKNAKERSRIPEALCRHIVDICERG